MKRLKGILIALIIFFIVGHFSFQIINSRTFQLFGNIYQKVETQEKVVALTFDDGPTELTEETLQKLSKLDVKATFFLRGSNMRQNPEYTKKIVNSGHQIANHTFTHAKMIFKSPRFMEEEIRRTNIEIKKAGYEGEIFFRPPYGKKFVFLPIILHKYGMRTITWSLEPESYPEIAKDSKLIANYITNNIKPGDVILLNPMNSNNEETLESLEIFIPELKEMGYDFKLVSDLFREE